MGHLAGGPGTSAWLLWDGQQLSHPIIQRVRCCGAQQGPVAASGVAQCHQSHTGLAPNGELGASTVFAQTRTADLVLDDLD